MTDHFAALGEDRRPWLEPAALKEKFHALSVLVHPDRVHQKDEPARRQAAERYASLNTAYQCLRDPKSRLQHLIILVRGTKPGDSHQIPEDLLRLFMEIGAVLRLADGLIAERRQIQSPLLRAQLLEKALPCLETVGRLQATLQERRARLDSDLQALDAAWQQGDPQHIMPEIQLRTAEHLYHFYGFIDRWLSQLQERSFQLAL